MTEIQNLNSEGEVWKYIKQFRNKKRHCESTSIPIVEWKKYFKELLHGCETFSERAIEKLDNEEKEEIIELRDEDLEKQMKKLKKGKAPGPDSIPNEAWIYSEDKVRNALKEICKKLWKGETLPMSWRLGEICPIFKQGNANEVGNYRGITLMNTGYKIYAMTLCEKLNEEAEKFLPESQSGFREGRSTMDNIYLLNLLIDRELEKKGGQLIACFVDYKAAFDTVDRNVLWKIMERKGVNKWLIGRIKDIYKETKNVVRVGDRKSEVFWTVRGVRQGCPLSPTLFAIYISEIDEILEKAQTGGILLGRNRIKTLAYADDLVLLSREEYEMKEMMNVLEKFSNARKLTLNTNKTKIMIFKRGRGKARKTNWQCANEEIEEVRQFKYLGFTFQRNNGVEKHLKEQQRKAIIAMKQTWSIGQKIFTGNIEKRLWMFDYLVRSILFYGVEIWGWKEEQGIEAVQERYVRWILGVDRHTPGYLVRDEVKREKLRIHAGQRSWRHEKEVRKKKKKYLIACIEDIDKNEDKKERKWLQKRKGYMERNGWSVQEVRRMIEKGVNAEEEFIKRDRQLEGQERWNNLENAKFCPRYKNIRGERNLPIYLNGWQKDVQVIARFRLGNEEAANKYWIEEGKECRICSRGKETMEHMVKDCIPELRTEIKIEDILHEDGRGKWWMKKVLEEARKNKL